MKRNVIRRKAIELKSRSDRDADPGDGGVQSVDRALLIIETLAEDDEGYRLTDLAVRTGLSSSTVHRLLTTLEKRRFVQFDRDELMWHIGAQSFAVGSTFVRRRNFVTQALPYLRKLRKKYAVIQDDDRLVTTLQKLWWGAWKGPSSESRGLSREVHQASREIMRSVTKVGGRVPMVASGLGKALLSTYSEQDVFAIIQREGMPRLTSKSIVRAGELSKSLHDIRQQGYSVDDEEALIGLRCVSAVVYDDCSEPLAAISVSGKASRVPNDRLPVLGKLVQEVAAELTKALGGVVPDAKSL